MVTEFLSSNGHLKIPGRVSSKSGAYMVFLK
jgi:hypothetical protein